MYKFRAKICKHITEAADKIAPDFCSDRCKLSNDKIEEQLSSNDPYKRISRANYLKLQHNEEKKSINYSIRTRKAG